HQQPVGLPDTRRGARVFVHAASGRQGKRRTARVDGKIALSKDGLPPLGIPARTRAAGDDVPRDAKLAQVRESGHNAVLVGDTSNRSVALDRALLRPAALARVD